MMCVFSGVCVKMVNRSVGRKSYSKRFKMELRYVLIGMYDIYVCVIALSLFSLARLTRVMDIYGVKVKDG